MKKLLLISVLTCTLLLGLSGFSTYSHANSNAEIFSQETTPYFDSIANGRYHRVGISFSPNPQQLRVEFMDQHLQPPLHRVDAMASILDVETGSIIASFHIVNLNHVHTFNRPLAVNRGFIVTLTGSVHYGWGSPAREESFVHRLEFAT